MLRHCLAAYALPHQTTAVQITAPSVAPVSTEESSYNATNRGCTATPPLNLRVPALHVSCMLQACYTHAGSPSTPECFHKGCIARVRGAKSDAAHIRGRALQGCPAGRDRGQGAADAEACHDDPAGRAVSCTARRGFEEEFSRDNACSPMHSAPSAGNSGEQKVAASLMSGVWQCCSMLLTWLKVCHS